MDPLEPEEMPESEWAYSEMIKRLKNKRLEILQYLTKKFLQEVTMDPLESE
jgi:hypothetical protein